MEAWGEALGRGAAARTAALVRAGGALSSEEVAELLNTTASMIAQRQQGGELLAVTLPNGDRAYPARQFTPDGRVRAGLKDVLAAFTYDEDPWIILSFLASPDLVSDEEIALDSLDDPAKTRALVNLACTFWEQGAT